MSTYKITGGTKLVGKVRVRGAKNAGFKALIAALLADTQSEICNLGLISEIDFSSKVITSLGGKVTSLSDPHDLVIDPQGLKNYEIPEEIAGKSRSSTMYVGPLLKKFGKAILPFPGGDISIAKRPIDRHIAGLSALGAKIEIKDGKYIVTAPNGLIGTNYRFSKNTHTGTETLLMCAVFARGDTVLENAAEEPEVDNLIEYLRNMGAKIERIGRTIKISGVKDLTGARHRIINDRLEAATFGSFALASRGEIEVIGADKNVLVSFLEKVEEIGGAWDETSNGILFKYDNPLVSTDITTKPYPGFMTDWQPTWSALMTQAQGISKVHETVMENRFAVVADLIKMGAKIEYFAPNVENPEEFYNFNLEDRRKGTDHGIKIFGPANLHGEVLEIDDIRRGASIVLAGISASGVTTIIDTKDQIRRGYEDLVGKLVNLGANIDVVYN